jgi:DHA3 family tetracycline resistance protein-like MFS transporter
LNTLRQPLLRERDPYRVFLTYAGLSSLAFTLVFTINMVYQAQTVGLGPLQLVLVGTVLEGTVFLCEIPTGVVADVYSRRLSVIIGAGLIGVGFLVEGLVPTFGGVLLAQVLWGFGWTFTSGANEAWLADEIGEDAAGKAYLRASQVGQLTSAGGIILSVTIASIRLNYAVVAGGLMHLTSAAFLLLYMPENGFTPTPKAERETLGTMVHTTRDGARMIKRRPVLLTIIAVTFIYGAASESFDRLWTLHLLENFTLPIVGNLDPVVWFGVISLVSLLIGATITEALRRRVKTDQQSSIVHALLRINGLLVVMIVAFALMKSFALALLLYWLIAPLRGLQSPLMAAWTNRGLDPQVRATVLSMVSQTDAIGQVAGGPAIGYVGDVYGVRTALAAGGVILSPLLLLYGRTLRRDNVMAPVDAVT